MMQPQIILLREGTDSSQGRGQLISNINACQAVTDTVRSTLGPRGMDKLIVDQRGRQAPKSGEHPMTAGGKDRAGKTEARVRALRKHTRARRGESGA